jgi:TusA-related sulfurtransferase
MTGPQVIGAQVRLVGTSWVQAVAERQFGQLAALCQPDVCGRLLTPRAFDTVGDAQNLGRKFQQWFGEADLIRIEHTQVHQVGEKMALFYRLLVRRPKGWFEIEQQISGLLKEGRVSRLDLLCSGFQPVPSPGDALSADAVLQMATPADGEGSTCAVLTPAIKERLRDMSSGQVLKVQVEDAEVRGDIEAWCRLSGNELLTVTEADNGAGFSYFVRKK